MEEGKHYYLPELPSIVALIGKREGDVALGKGKGFMPGKDCLCWSGTP